MVDRWQEAWEGSRETAGWTRELIPNIRNWIECRHKVLCYEVTQVLSGHGCFRNFTYRIGKEDAPTCVYCNDGSEDTVEHTMIRCRRWEDDRTVLGGRVGLVATTKDLVDMMLQREEWWKTGLTFIKKVISVKEKEERRRQEGRAEEDELSE